MCIYVKVVSIYVCEIEKEGEISLVVKVAFYVLSCFTLMFFIPVTKIIRNIFLTDIYHLIYIDKFEKINIYSSAVTLHLQFYCINVYSVNTMPHVGLGYYCTYDYCILRECFF